jgi:hypothetical protein
MSKRPIEQMTTPLTEKKTEACWTCPDNPLNVNKCSGICTSDTRTAIRLCRCTPVQGTSRCRFHIDQTRISDPEIKIETDENGDTSYTRMVNSIAQSLQIDTDRYLTDQSGRIAYQKARITKNTETEEQDAISILPTDLIQTLLIYMNSEEIVQTQKLYPSLKKDFWETHFTNNQSQLTDLIDYLLKTSDGRVDFVNTTYPSMEKKSWGTYFQSSDRTQLQLEKLIEYVLVSDDKTFIDTLFPLVHYTSQDFKYSTLDTLLAREWLLTNCSWRMKIFIEGLVFNWPDAEEKDAEEKKFLNWRVQRAKLIW